MQERRVSVPCGVFVFLNEEELREERKRRIFRPLRGLRVSQSCTE